MAKKEESAFKEKVLKDLKHFKSAYYFKTQERSRRGVPDIIGSIKGKFFALELKTDTGKLDALQVHILHKIRESSGFALVTSPSTWADHFAAMKGYFK